MIMAGMTVSGPWLFVSAVSDVIIRRSNMQEGYCGSHTATPECYSHPPSLKITSVGSSCSTRPTTALQMAPVEMPCTTLQGESYIDFSELRKSTVYLLIIKKEDCVSQNMVLWATKLSFFVPWNSRVWLSHLRPIILHRFSKLTKAAKWAMIRRQPTTLQFTLYPAFASNFGVCLLAGWGGGGVALTTGTKDFLIWEPQIKQIVAIQLSPCWTALLEKRASSLTKINSPSLR